ncbi:MAG: hypothetical protein ACTSX0_01505 [Promethearchaeota archaeon]
MGEKKKTCCCIFWVILLLIILVLAADTFLYDFLPWFDLWELITGTPFTKIIAST